MLTAIIYDRKEIHPSVNMDINSSAPQTAKNLTSLVTPSFWRAILPCGNISPL